MSENEPRHIHPEVPPELHPELPEHRRSRLFAIWWVAGSVGGWISPLFVVAFTLGWSLLIYWLIGNRPTEWKYGVFPYVPAQSVFTTSPVPSGKVPSQVELPAAIKRHMHGI